MSILTTFASAVATGSIEVVDLTAPLSAETPVVQLPPQFAQTAPFELEELSRYDDRGPAWYWNDFRTGEPSGTHFDAPVHWVTGRDGDDVASVPGATPARSSRRPGLVGAGGRRPRLPAGGAVRLSGERGTGGAATDMPTHPERAPASEATQAAFG